MKLKAFAAGALLAAASFGASAAPVTHAYTFDPLESSGFDTSSLTGGKYNKGIDFYDSWTFTIAVPSATSFGAQQTFAAAAAEISNFGAELNGQAFSLVNNPADGQQNLSWKGNLAAGSYTVHVWGHVNANKTQYTATVSALPVPEPETYGMLLGGLGVLGLVARRKAKKAA